MLGSRCAALLLAALAATANAGTVYQSAVVATPQMQVRAGDTDGCGFQLKSLPMSLAGEKTAVMLDVSLNLYAGFFAGMKGGASQIGMTGGKPNASKVLPITSFWLKAAGGKATVPLQGKVMLANDPGYLIYGADFSLVTELMAAVLDGQQLSLSVHIKGEPVERIYMGAASLDESEKAQTRQCMVELAARMKAIDEAENVKQPKQ